MENLTSPLPDQQPNVDLYSQRAILTQFHLWYPYFKKYSFKAEVLELSPRFIEYLNKDGVFLPENEDNDSDDSSDSENNDDQKAAKL